MAAGLAGCKEHTALLVTEILNFPKTTGEAKSGIRNNATASAMEHDNTIAATAASGASDWDKHVCVRQTVCLAHWAQGMVPTCLVRFKCTRNDAKWLLGNSQVQRPTELCVVGEHKLSHFGLLRFRVDVFSTLENVEANLQAAWMDQGQGRLSTNRL